MQWEEISGGKWIFGEKVRGIIRRTRAKVVCISDCRWSWAVFDRNIEEINKGEAATLVQAIESAESDLGIQVYLE